jgi:hypothetical protein
MDIDPFSETPISFAEAARRLPRLRNGRPVSPATLWRWASHGLRGVRLETVRVGGTCCTSLEALRRFFERIGLSAGDRPSAPQLSTRRAEAGGAELDRLGI